MIGGELTSSGIRDEVMDGAVEVCSGEEILKGDVHSPAPVVAGDGRDVDPLILRLALVADLTVDGHPVLKREDTQHRRRVQMLVYNPFTDPRFAEIRSRPIAVKNLMEETLGHRSVLLPPATQSGCVVRAGRAD